MSRIGWLIAVVAGFMALVGAQSYAQSLDNVVLPAVELPSDDPSLQPIAMPDPPSDSPPQAQNAAPVAMPAVEMPAVSPAPQANPAPVAEAISVPPLQSDSVPSLPPVELAPEPAPQAQQAQTATPDTMPVTSPAADVATPAAGALPATDVAAVPATPDETQPAMPATTSQAPSGSAAPDAAAMAALPPAAQPTQLATPAGLSIGNFGVSLMYSDEDINNLRQVLEVFEAVKTQSTQTADGEGNKEADLLAELLRASKGEPEALPEVAAKLPSYYVGSIMIHNQGDWSVWVNGTLFNKKRTKNDAMGLRIVSVNRDALTLAWKPSNVAQAYQRYQDVQKEMEEAQKAKAKPQEPKADNPAETVDEAAPETPSAEGGSGAVEALMQSASSPFTKEKTHREARFARIEFDKEAGEFTVRLRPNQTFVANSMQVMEGRFADGIMTASEAEKEGAEASANPAQAGAADPMAGAAAAVPGTTTDERALANKLLGNLQKIGNVASSVTGGTAPAIPTIPTAAPTTTP